MAHPDGDAYAASETRRPPRSDPTSTLYAVASRLRAAKAESGGLLDRLGFWLQRHFYDQSSSSRLSAESSLLPWRARRLIAAVPELSFTLCPSNRTPATSAKRALLISHDFSGSGAPRIVVEVAGILSDWGWDVLVLSPSSGPVKRMVQDAGAASASGPLVFQDPALLATLASHSDVAIFNTTETLSLIPPVADLVPCFSYLHEISLLQRRLGEPPSASGLRAARGVWAGNTVTATIARQVASDVETFPYGLARLKSSAMVRVADDHLVIGVFGSYEARKGQDLIAGALMEMGEHASRIEIRMYGRVLEKSFFRMLQSDTEAWPQIRIYGELDSNAYVRAMDACDVVLVPSRDDTLPLVSLDALGLGKVLVCTETTGTSAYIQDGVSGFIAKMASSSAIGAALTRAVLAQASLAQVAEMGQSVFDQNFSKQAFERALATRLGVEMKAAR